MNYFNICISDIIAEHFNLTAQKNTKVVYNGIASQKSIHERRDIVKTFTTTITYGVVGLIMEYKKQLEIMQAFVAFLKEQKGSIDNYKLRIIGSAGSNNYFIKVLKYIIDNELEESIEIYEHIEKQEDIYAMIDVLIVGAEYEGFGRVSAEALTFGIPVLGFDSAGTAEIVRDGIDGWKYSNFSELTALFTKIAADPCLLPEMHTSIKNNFRQEFTIEYYGNEIVNGFKL
jgi:glycosyltransferase involved in cell wall biosynthesis